MHECQKRRTIGGVISAALVVLLATNACADTIDTVRVGSASLKGAAPFLMTDTIDSYVLRDGKRTDTNRKIRTITTAREGDTHVLDILTVHITLPAGDSTVNRTRIRAADLSLIRHGVRAETDSGLVTYLDGRLVGWAVPPGEDGHDIDTAIAPSLPDDGLAPWLLELLPYKDGYRATVPVFSMWSVQDKWQKVRLLGSETLSKDGRSVECWRVAVEGVGPPGFDQIRWISKSSRRLLQQVYRKNPDDPQFWAVTRNWF